MAMVIIYADFVVAPPRMERPKKRKEKEKREKRKDTERRH